MARDREAQPTPADREPLRDWHRLFGLLLRDFLTGTGFVVEIERDLSEQQQFLDVVILRRRPGRIRILFPDGLTDLVAHNLITFKSHHEALDAWAIKELIGYYVAYRKLVSPSPSDLLPEDQFRLYAICARFPHNLSGLVPWQQVQAGVYDCQWGTDRVRVIVARELSRQPQNAPLHLFSASPELVGFGQRAYQQHSETSSRLLGRLFEGLRREGLTMSFTIEDFNRDYVRRYFAKLTPEEQQEAFEALPPNKVRELVQSLPPNKVRELVQSLPAEERLAGLPPEARLAGLSPAQIRQYLDQLTGSQPTPSRKPRRRK